MTPTATDVYAKVRSLLSDEEVAGGDVFTNTVLLPHLQEAVNTLFRTLHHAESPLLNVKVYFFLEPYRHYVDLDGARMGDFGEMLSIRSKAHAASGTISALAFSGGGWVVTTSAAHGRSTGDLIYVWGVTAAADEFINADWRVTVLSTTTMRLIGSPNNTTSGSYTADSALWMAGMGEWSEPFRQVEGLQDVSDSAVSWRQPYDLRSGSLRFAPDPQPRILEINYRMRPDQIVATAPNLRVRGSLDVLSYLTAAAAAHSKNADQTARSLYGRAAGADSLAQIDERNPGGLLGELAQQHATARRGFVQTQRFRGRRYHR